MKDEHLEALLGHFKQLSASGTLVKLTLSKPRVKSNSLRNVFVKPVYIKGVRQLSFVYSEDNKHRTQNFSEEQAIDVLRQLLGGFRAANLLGIRADYEWLSSKNGTSRLTFRPVDSGREANLSHDREKKRFLDPRKPYWFSLGITSRDGVVLPSMQHKFKQVDKYIGLLDPLLPEEHKGILRVVDMGSGKGYLTFAFFEHLKARYGNNISVTGVEQRSELVELTNQIVLDHHLDGLSFVKGSIESFKLQHADVLIALHACDTATDDAIAAGIHIGASVIVCAPCCHKQIRREMLESAEKLPLFRYGILLERQAEILTDTLRALIMEKYGYKTRIAEFIDAEHTPKNIMLAGIKKKMRNGGERIDDQIAGLKAYYGITTHYLETALAKLKLL